MPERTVYISTSAVGMASKYHLSKRCASGGRQRHGNFCGGLLQYPESKAIEMGKTLCSRCAARFAAKA